LVAGLNAACRIKDLPGLVLSRVDGYTGILIDDLISKGADEPYRMFTSRAEFRLRLRIDNADERLTPKGRQIGLVDERRWAAFVKKQEQKSRITELLNSTRGREIAGLIGSEAANGDNPTLVGWLRRPEARIEMLRGWIASRLCETPVHGVLTTVETEAKYAGYINQQQRQIIRLKQSEGRPIPAKFSYERIPGLSIEVKQKLERVRPATLGQAGRIPGVTPAAISVLDIYLSLQ
jgi:tRNA uridine 5-carboxymethylaminomethyl modification enzyme